LALAITATLDFYRCIPVLEKDDLSLNLFVELRSVTKAMWFSGVVYHE
jgi:hypothetical protein